MALLDVVDVAVDADAGKLLLVFANGEHRCFDMLPWLKQKPWVRIQPRHLFEQAFIENGTVAWPGNVDIAPETLYDLSEPLASRPCAR